MNAKLREYQLRAVEAIRAAIRARTRYDGTRVEGRGMRVLLQLPTGGGKCLGKGTMVLRFNGALARVEDIVVGDTLMGPDSGPRTVTSVCQGRERLYRVVPTKGDPYIVNESHILSLRRTFEDSSAILQGSLPCVDTSVAVTVHRWLSETDTFRHLHKGWRAAIDFQTKQVPLDPYMLGLWLGDGTTGGAGLTTVDVEPEQAWRAWAADRGLDIRRTKGDGSPTYYMTTRRHGCRPNAMVDALRACGVLNSKRVPLLYRTNDRETRLAVLAGLMDTDGHLSHSGFDYVSVIEALADDVCFIARSLGLAAYKSPCRKECTNNGVWNTYYRVSISGDCSIIPCRIPRKRSAPRLQKKNVLLTGIHLEPIGEGDYYGFTLAGADRLFLLGDFTVTHNTLTGAHMIAGALAKGAKSIFAVHRMELVDQTVRAFARLGILSVGVMRAGDKRTDASQPIQVCSVQTLARRQPVPGVKLVFVDECHRSCAPTYRDHLFAAYPDAVFVGLSATPCRADGKPLGEHWDALIPGATYSQLIADGYIVAPLVYTTPLQPDLSAVSTTAGDYNREELEEAVNKRALIGDILTAWQRRNDGRRTVVFAVGVAHSQAIVSMFREAGATAEHLDGETPEPERCAILARLASGETQVVANVGVLTEGWDLPACKCLILARPTKSLALYIQMGGRILRPWCPLCGDRCDLPGHESAVPVILDHGGNVDRKVNGEPMGMPHEDRAWSLDAKPKRVGAAPMKACPECFAMIAAAAGSCPHCGHEFPPPAPPEPPAAELTKVELALRNIGDGEKNSRIKFFQSLCETAVERGWKAGAVNHKYEERHGELPPRAWYVTFRNAYKKDHPERFQTPLELLPPSREDTW